MDRSKASALHTRNRAIIDAIIKKAEQCCPDALDLVAVTGSFSRDEYYEKSDLDLLIVINAADGALGLQIIVGRHIHVDRRAFNNCAHPTPGFADRGGAIVHTKQRKTAAVGVDQTCDQTDDGGLAGAVFTDKAVNIAALDVHINTIDGKMFFVAFCQCVGGKYISHQ